ncbi:Xylose operon regulatory protein [compost metagenome]
MAKAEQLLQADDLKLPELAQLVGYSSLSHFVSAFKKYSGKSPKEYRERIHRTR